MQKIRKRYANWTVYAKDVCRVARRQRNNINKIVVGQKNIYIIQDNHIYSGKNA